MDWEFQHAPDGNIALTGELDPTGAREFTLGLAFGNSQHHAVSTLFQSLSTPFAEHEKRYAEQWGRTGAGILSLEKSSGDGGNLYRASCNLLLAHEDKSYPGAFTVYFVFALGALASNFPLNYAFIRWPVSGARLSIGDYCHGGAAVHENAPGGGFAVMFILFIPGLLSISLAPGWRSRWHPRSGPWRRFSSPPPSADLALRHAVQVL